MDTPLITVFTPTYNRVHTLPKLFQSLCNQTCLNFEWLIVDDGSIDGTKELIQNYIISEPPFRINYIWQANAGKAMAINRAASEINTFYVYFMDSDDYLPENAIENVLPYLCSIQKDVSFSGVTGLRVDKKGNPIGSYIPNPILDTDYLSFRYKYKALGDYAEILKTSILKEYMFPHFENEKFCTEAVIFNRIAKKYVCRFVNCPLRVTEYLPGGLTETYNKILQDSPNYSMLYYKELFYSSVPLGVRLSALCSYWDFKCRYEGKIKKDVVPTFKMKFFGVIVVMLRKTYRLIRWIRK